MVYSQVARSYICRPKPELCRPKFLVKSPENFIMLSNSLTSRLFRVIKSLKTRYITHLTGWFRFIKAKNEVYYIHSSLQFRATWLKLSGEMTFGWLDRLPTKSLVNSESKRGDVVWFAIVLKTDNFSLFKWNSKNNGQVLFFKTIVRYWNCFLSSVGKDGKDGRGLKNLKLELELGCFNAMPPKISRNILMITASRWNCLSRGKGSKTMTSAQHWPKTATIFFKPLNWVRWIID